MRIDSLLVENFKGFARRDLTFHPHFNLVVGENGTGKTSVLDALSIAAGSWFLGLRGYDTRHIRPEDVRLQSFTSDSAVTWERQYPCAVEARGLVQDQVLTWRRTLSPAAAPPPARLGRSRLSRSASRRTFAPATRSFCR